MRCSLSPLVTNILPHNFISLSLLVIVDLYMYIYNTPAKMSIAKADVFLDSSDEGEIEDVYQQELDMQVRIGI